MTRKNRIEKPHMTIADVSGAISLYPQNSPVRIRLDTHHRTYSMGYTMTTLEAPSSVPATDVCFSVETDIDPVFDRMPEFVQELKFARLSGQRSTEANIWFAHQEKLYKATIIDIMLGIVTIQAKGIK